MWLSTLQTWFKGKTSVPELKLSVVWLHVVRKGVYWQFLLSFHALCVSFSLHASEPWFFPALGLQWGVGCSGDVKKAREVLPSLLLQRLPWCSLTLVGCFSMTLSAGGLSCGFFQDSPQDFLSRVVLAKEGASSLYLVSYSFSFSPWEFSHSPLATFCWEPIVSLAHDLRQNLK